jgi:hypothetical protein
LAGVHEEANPSIGSGLLSPKNHWLQALEGN